MSSATLWTAEETQLAEDWGKRAVAAQHAHYYLAAGLKKRNLALGIPVVIFTTVVGTSLFASMASTASESAGEELPRVGEVPDRIDQHPGGGPGRHPDVPPFRRARGTTCAGGGLVRLDPEGDRGAARPPRAQTR